MSSDTRAEKGYPATGSGWVLLILIALASLAQTGVNIMLPALPEMSAALSFNGDAELVLSAYLIAFAAGMLVTGPISDQIGRKPVLIAGLAVFFAGGLMTSLAQDVTVMMAGRVIQGLGASAGMSVGRAVARDLYDGPRLIKVYGILTMAMAVVPGLAPFIGGLVVVDFGWRVVLAVPIAVATFILLAVIFVLRESLERTNEPPTVKRVVEGYRHVLGSRIFLTFALGNSLTLGGLYAFAAGSPAHFIGVLGHPPSLYGFLPMVPAGSYLAGAFLASRIAQHPERFRPFYIGSSLLILAGAAGTVFAALNDYPDIFPVMVFIAAYGLGMGGILPLGVSGAMQPFRQNAGTAAAMLGAMQMSAGALATALMSAIPAPPLLGFASLLLACAIGVSVIAIVTKPQLNS